MQKKTHTRRLLRRQFSQTNIKFLYKAQGTPSSEALEFKYSKGPMPGLFKDLSKMAVAIQPSRRKQVINW